MNLLYFYVVCWLLAVRQADICLRTTRTGLFILMNNITYVELSIEQLKRLEKADDVLTAKTLLSAMFGVPQDPSQEWRATEDSALFVKDEPLWAILSDLYFYAFVFSKEQRFNRSKTSAFMGIVKKVVEMDINSVEPDMQASFSSFKELVFAHSVERHPVSSKIFEPAESKAILQYITESYFRHFKLYRYNFTKRKQQMFVQSSTSCVESARAPRPLSQAMTIANKVVSQEVPETEGPETDAQSDRGMPTFTTSTVTMSQEKPIMLSSVSVPTMTSHNETVVAGSPTNAARAKRRAGEKLKLMKASPDMRWQYRWSCNSKMQWGTYPTAVTNAIEEAFVAQQDRVIDVGGGSFKLFRCATNCLVNEQTGEQLQVRRLDPCPSIALRKVGQVAKAQSQAATEVAYGAVGRAFENVADAEKHIKAARRRRAVNSCALKLMLIYRNLRIRMRKELMRRIQARVVALMADNKSGIVCSLIEVDLIHSEVKIKEQVKFEGGKAVIKPESDGLLQQLAVCKKCISQTCQEFSVPNMHWRVEGHTAESKKSTDGGMRTSTERAKAVCEFLGSKGIDTSYLHPKGCGCYHPPPNPKADPRRVEVHVMTPEEVQASRQRKMSYTDMKQRGD